MSYDVADYLLICEGTCNPHLLDIDRAVAKALTRTRRWADGCKGEWNGVEAVGDENLWMDQRTLAYTVHTKRDTRWAVCTVCNYERQFGY